MTKRDSHKNGSGDRIKTAGIADKLGNWYEADYVALQLLKLLSGEVESVKWESFGVNRGMDLWLRKEGIATSVQCKTKTDGRWTILDLSTARGSGNHYLGHAKAGLQSDPGAVTHFVSDATFPSLAEMIGLARAATPESSLSPTSHRDWLKLLNAWQLEDNRDGKTEATDLLLRMRTIVCDATSLNDDVNSVARTLAGRGADQLVGLVVKFARTVLGRWVFPDELRQKVRAAGINLEPRVFDPYVDERLGEIRGSFVQHTAEVRGLPHLPRADVVAEVLAWTRTGAASSLVVHGPAGAGKTEILAEVIQSLTASGVAVLVLRPSPSVAVDGLGNNPVGALKRFAAGRPALLVIDQIDQIVHAGTLAQQHLDAVRRWADEARRLDIPVIAGCRTTDVLNDTQLHAILAEPNGQMTRVKVGDLTEEQVHLVLDGVGIAKTVIPLRLRATLRRPIHLRLLVKLHEKGINVSQVENAADLTDLWWQHVRFPFDDAADIVFDRLIDRMECDGLFSATADGLRPDVVEHLVAAGVLVRKTVDGRMSLAAAHQLFIDMRIAQRWRDCRTPADLLASIGDRNAQTLHQARRLRFALPLLAARGNGVRLLQALGDSTELRPLTKRAILLGLADLERPPIGVVDLVTAWIDKNDDFGLLAVNIILSGRLGWTRACQPWMESRFRTWQADKQRWLARLVASVAQEWGDDAAKLLAGWSAVDADIYEQALNSLGRDLTKDCDSLFRFRLEAIRRQPTDHEHFDWMALLQAVPVRGLAVLAVVLAKTPLEKLLKHGDDGMSGLRPGRGFPSETGSCRPNAWEQLVPWWVATTVPDLRNVSTRWDILPSCEMVSIVDMMAEAAAHSLAVGEGSWSDLLLALRGPLRDQDVWLLLRVGALLPEGPGAVDAANAACAWFESDIRFSRVQLGWDRMLEFQLQLEFMRTIARSASRSALAHVADALLGIREPWTSNQEHTRFSMTNAGYAAPSDLGKTAHRLLPALLHRLGQGAVSQRWSELDRKFGAAVAAAARAHSAGGGIVRSVIPDHVARSWTPIMWRNQLASAPRRDNWRWGHNGKGYVGAYDVDSLSRQLAELAPLNQERFLAVAAGFSDAVPARARESVLAGLLSTRRPPAAQEDWRPIDSAKLLPVVTMPCYLEAPECAKAIGWAVQERPNLPWPSSVFDRLETIARTTPPDSIFKSKEDNQGLPSFRLNDTGCVATQALAAAALHHATVLAKLLQLAEDLSCHPCPGRRASAGIAAVAAYGTDPERSARLVVGVARDELVCADHDVSHAVMWLARNPKAPVECRPNAQRLAIGLTENSSTHGAEQGGIAVLVLLRDGVLGVDSAMKMLDSSLHAKRAAARNLSHWIGEGDDWELGYQIAERWAADSDRETADAIFRLFRADKAGEWFSDRIEFTKALLALPSAARNVDDIVVAFDKVIQLIPVAGLVIGTARALARLGGDAHFHASDVCARLGRLMEETEQTRAFDVLASALDAWDELLVAGVYDAGRLLAGHLE